MIEVNDNIEDLLEEEKQRRQFDPLKLHKLENIPEIDVVSITPDNIEQLVNTKTGKVGRPKKPPSPFSTVEVNENGHLTVIPTGRGQPKKELQLLKQGKVSEQTLYNIAHSYYYNPDWKVVAQLTGHTADFLITFAKTLKFHDLLAQIRAELDKKEEASETAIVESALVELKDRVVNGDDILDSKTGQVVKVKMKGKELASVVKTIHTVRQTTRKEPVAFSQKESQADRLARLADTFAKFTQAKTIDNSTGEIE